MNALLERGFAIDVSGLGQFVQPALRVLLIALLAWVLIGLAQRLIRRFRMYMSSRATSADDVKRLETLGRVFRYVAAVVISLVAGTLILGEIGISVAPILATAGVAGIAIGFGAQSLVRDYFTGLFMLLEDQIRQGDVVEVAGKGGLVEEVTLRYVRLRDYEGNVHFVPNGTISTVTNRSRGFAFSVMDLGVAYREDVDEVFELIRKVAADLRSDEVFGPKILEDIDLAGVDQWGDSAVVIKCRVKVRPLEQWSVRREFLRRMKRMLDEHGIEIPYPHLTVYPGQRKDGSAPALRLLDAGATRGNGS